jgi:RNA:NAD 2'-phosphotransferase (TPT1/KptA family)
MQDRLIRLSKYLAIILTVDAGRMHKEAHKFWLSANGVWLADAVSL